jgi:type IV pilus biogenesis protein CpaD/CtpE
MSRLPMRVTTMVMSAFALVGCASVATPRTAPYAVRAEAPMLGNEVSGTELTASGATTLYDALVRTRRQYFAARGATSMLLHSPDAILVFRAGMLMGEMDVLKMLRPTDVRVVRRLTAVDTYYKYGKHVSVGGLEIELVNE